MGDFFEQCSKAYNGYKFEHNRLGPTCHTIELLLTFGSLSEYLFNSPDTLPIVSHLLANKPSLNDFSVTGHGEHTLPCSITSWVP